MKDLILNLEEIHSYYKKRADELFDEWLSATDKEVADYILEQIWSKYRNFEGKCEGVLTALLIAKQHKEETLRR